MIDSTPRPERREVQYLRRAIFHIEGNGTTGTGFFVRKHVLVTCSHVLHRDPKQVALTDAYGDETTGRIIDRDPTAPGFSGDYDFPDLGFVGTHDSLDTPVAELPTSAGLLARPGLVVRALAFNRRTPESRPVLDPVELRVVGKSGRDGRLIKATADGVTRGMSGAPVYDPETGLVLGMLKHYRSEQRAAWIVDGYDIQTFMATRSRALGRHRPNRPRLIRPEPGDPLHAMLRAQTRVAEELPYQVVDGDVPLSAVYVQQRATAYRAEVRRAAARGLAPPREPAILTTYDMVAKHRNALLIGGPGSGKSTLLQRIVLDSAKWWLDPEPAATGDQPPFGAAVAVRCPASHVARQAPLSETLAASLNAELGGSLSTRLLPDLFEAPPAHHADWLILVDGLDEVLDASHRMRLIDGLADRVSAYGSARFVVTSRNLAEREFDQLRPVLRPGQDDVERLGEYDLRPFDRPSVQEFGQRWFTLRTPDFAKERTAGFLANVDRSRLMPLMEVPLLCTIAADVYEKNPDRPLPIGRAGLYERFVDGLLNRRRGEPGTRERIRDQLAPLGRRAEDFGESLFDRRLDCITFLAELRMNSNVTPTVDNARGWLESEGLSVPVGVTDDHIREILLSTGLLVLRSGELDFSHLSIAEYLASGRAATELDPRQWLARVADRGADSISLFALDRWASVGNDPSEIVDALGAPGEARRYPQLRQLAAVLHDGAGLASGSVDRAVEVAVQAVFEVDGTSAIDAAMTAVVQRASSIDVAVQIVQDDRLALAKRIAAAKALITVGTPEESATGLNLLDQIAYEARISRGDKLRALRSLVDVAPPNDSDSALQHLTHIIVTSNRNDIRALAMVELLGAGKRDDVAMALLHRAASPDRSEDERIATLGEFNALWPEPYEYEYGLTTDGRPAAASFRGRLPVGHTWTPPREVRLELRSEGRPVLIQELAAAIRIGFSIDRDEVNDLVARIVHDRTLSWGDRAHLAWLIAEPGELDSDALFERLSEDSSIPPSVGLVHRWRHMYGPDPQRAEALLVSVARTATAGITERTTAIDLLLSRHGADVALPIVCQIAANSAAPPPLRIAAARAAARWQPGFVGNTRMLLAEVMRSRAVGWRWRLMAAATLATTSRSAPPPAAEAAMVEVSPSDVSTHDVTPPTTTAPQAVTLEGASPSRPRADSGEPTPGLLGAGSARPRMAMRVLSLAASTAVVASAFWLAIAEGFGIGRSAVLAALVILAVLALVTARDRPTGLVAYATVAATLAIVVASGLALSAVFGTSTALLTTATAVFLVGVARFMPSRIRGPAVAAATAVGALTSVGLAVQALLRLLGPSLAPLLPVRLAWPDSSVAWAPVVAAVAVATVAVALMNGSARLDALLGTGLVLILATAHGWWGGPALAAVWAAAAAGLALQSRRRWDRSWRLAAATVLIVYALLAAAVQPLAAALVCPILILAGAATVVLEWTSPGRFGRSGATVAEFGRGTAIIATVIAWLVGSQGLDLDGAARDAVTLLLTAAVVLDATLRSSPSDSARPTNGAAATAAAGMGMVYMLGSPTAGLAVTTLAALLVLASMGALTAVTARALAGLDDTATQSNTPEKEVGRRTAHLIIELVPRGTGLAVTLAVLCLVAGSVLLANTFLPGTRLITTLVAAAAGLSSLIPFRPHQRRLPGVVLAFTALAAVVVASVVAIVQVVILATAGGVAWASSAEAFRDAALDWSPFGWQVPAVLTVSTGVLSVAGREWRSIAAIAAILAGLSAPAALALEWWSAAVVALTMLGLATGIAIAHVGRTDAQPTQLIVPSIAGLLALGTLAGGVGLMVGCAGITGLLAYLSRRPPRGWADRRRWPTTMLSLIVLGGLVGAVVSVRDSGLAVAAVLAGCSMLAALTVRYSPEHVWLPIAARATVGLSAVAAVWTLLAHTGVAVVEAYTLPLPVVAWFALRGTFRSGPNWIVEGVSLGAALVPSLFLTVMSSSPPWRWPVLLVIAAVIGVLGARRRSLAMWVIGRITVMVVVATQVARLLIGTLPVEAVPLVVGGIALAAAAYHARVLARVGGLEWLIQPEDRQARWN